MPRFLLHSSNVDWIINPFGAFYSFEEITLLPTPRLDDAESDEDLKPPVSSLLDIRPRRRRDSALPIELEASRPPPPKAQPQTTTDSSANKPKKRRYEERDQMQDVEPSLNLDFKFTKLSQRTTQPTETQKPPVALVMLDEPEEDTVAMNEEELNEIEKIVEAGRRAVRLDPVEPKELVPTRETVTSNAAPTTMGRRALGPSKFLYLFTPPRRHKGFSLSDAFAESTNSDPSNSPMKQAAIKSSLPKERDLEKPEKPEFNAPPKIRDLEISSTDADSGTGRPSRRTKAGVNYALPNLRDKMRRDDKTGEPVKEERRTSRRAASGGRMRSKDSAEELVVKQEEFDEVEGIVGKQWFDLPVLPPTTSAVDAREELRTPKETGIGGLLERKSSRENDLEQPLPASVMTHRKRRMSSLHQSSLADLVHDGTNGRRADMSQIAAPAESRRKTVSFDPSSTTGSEGSQSRNRSESTALKRKQMVHSHLPPSSAHVDVVGEASAALNEIVRGSRRITLGGAAKGLRNAKSNGSLVGGEETEVEDNMPTSALGMGSRRRSMML